MAPVSADFPITALGVTSEAFQDSLRKYVRTNPDMALDTTVAVNKKVYTLSAGLPYCSNPDIKETTHSKHRGHVLVSCNGWGCSKRCDQNIPDQPGG